MNHKNIIALSVLILVMAVLAFFLLEWMIPKTAAFSIPSRWKRVPVREKRFTARNYYGLPTDSSAERDGWEDGTKNKTFRLNIYYNSDSIATSYSIHYRYRKGWLQRSYLLDTFSLK